MPRIRIDDGYPDYRIEAFIPEADPEGSNSITQDLVDQREIPVIWLLHGSFGDAADWFEYSKVSIYAQENGFALVAPSAGNSFYTNAVRGHAWEDIITKKIWKIAHDILPISRKPEKNLICGLSMGGYGALKLGLKHPELYSAIGCLSGGNGIIERYASGTEPMAEAWRMEDMFGPADQVLGSDNDLYTLARKAKEKGIMPPIYTCVGTRDVHEKESCPKQAEYLKELGFDVTWDEGDYDHEWRFWDIQVEKFMRLHAGK